MKCPAEKTDQNQSTLCVNILGTEGPGKEGFYSKHDFRKMKTGMALFSSAEKMAEKGFTD